jgi:hypothetical protein
VKDHHETGVADEEGSDCRPSWPYPTILFLYAIVFFISYWLGPIVGASLFFGLMGVCTWSACSSRQFEKLQVEYPSLLRSEYVANMLVLPVVVPLLIFVVLLVVGRVPS